MLRLTPAARAKSAGLMLLLVLASGAAGALELKPQQIQERYKRVLGTLGAGAEEAALEELFGLETEAISQYPSAVELERYWRLKLRVIRDLLQNGKLDQLIPVIVLHHDAFEMYQRQEKPLLAAHSRTMTSELAEILADRSGENHQARAFSGWVLTSLGAYLQQSQSVSRSADFFLRALTISPGNRAALLGLAAAHEKYGEYGLAVPLLEKVLSIEPAHHQARLRLGLCLIRDGRGQVGSTHLRKLTADDVPVWIRSVAFQELAALLLSEGKPGQAEGLLRWAIDELPDHQQPRVQLAAMLELSGRPAEASQIMSDIRPTQEGVHSPRYLYDQWPTEGLEEARARLQEMMQERLPLLAAALRSIPSEVGP